MFRINDELVLNSLEYFDFCVWKNSSMMLARMANVVNKADTNDIDVYMTLRGEVVQNFSALTDKVKKFFKYPFYIMDGKEINIKEC